MTTAFNKKQEPLLIFSYPTYLKSAQFILE